MTLPRHPRMSKANQLILALAKRPHTYKELASLLAGSLDPSNELHAELILDRPRNALKQARRLGYDIRFCQSTGLYRLSIPS